MARVSVWNFAPAPPSTEEVWEAFRQWYDPVYGNPDAQAAWEKAHRRGFELWLAALPPANMELARNSYDDGYRDAQRGNPHYFEGG